MGPSRHPTTISSIAGAGDSSSLPSRSLRSGPLTRAWQPRPPLAGGLDLHEEFRAPYSRRGLAPAHSKDRHSPRKSLPSAHLSHATTRPWPAGACSTRATLLPAKPDPYNSVDWHHAHHAFEVDMVR